MRKLPPPLPACALALALLLAPHGISARDAALVFGRTDAWQDFPDMRGATTVPGRWGDDDIVLAHAEYVPEAGTDLLLHFSSERPVDVASRYSVTGGNYLSAEKPALLGEACAAFLSPANAIHLVGRDGALFSSGVMWRDFSIEFWLYSAGLRDGETIISWSGERWQEDRIEPQRIRCAVANRRLEWKLENLFSRADGSGMSVSMKGLTPLLPREWHHHLLRFDSSLGLLEYLVDGVPEAVTYTTETGREGGSVALPVIGTTDARPLILGGNLNGFLDEVRITRTFVEHPSLTRFSPASGTATSRILDLGYSSTRISSIDAAYSRPADSEVFFYYRTAETMGSPSSIGGPWIRFAPGANMGSLHGRYLQIMVELFPDGALAGGPRVSEMTVRYEPDLPPAPPAKLFGEAGDTIARLYWTEVNEEDVAGYRVYYGTAPAAYHTWVDVGLQSSHEMTGLVNGRLYFFSVVAYDSADPPHRGAFSPEVSVRPAGWGTR